jgi:hypothetical protein
VPDRDRSVEHVLPRVLSTMSTDSSCVDGETLAAWTSGSLHPEQAAIIERHVADCSRCQAMMAAFVQSESTAPATESAWRRWRLGWLVPLATAATAAAVWIALPGNSAIPPPADRASRAVSLDTQAAPSAPAPAPSSPAAAPESAASAALSRPERADVQAGNEARQQLEETQARERPLDRLADAPAASPAENAEVDRRELASAPAARTIAARAQVMALEIVAPGAAARWRIVNGREVERSTSAGSEWIPASIDSPDVLTAGSAPSPSVCWIVGRRGVVYVTTDGLRFERVPFPEAADLVSVTATSDQAAAVSTADGRSSRTVDRGRTWSALE